MMPVATISLLIQLDDRRQVTEVASMLVMTKSFFALISLAAKKRIYINKNGLPGTKTIFVLMFMVLFIPFLILVSFTTHTSPPLNGSTHIPSPPYPKARKNFSTLR